MDELPTCTGPGCGDPPAVVFLGTRLCRDHAITANRRAWVNVWMFALGFAVPGVALASANTPGRPLFVAGVVMAVVAGILVVMGVYFKVAADRL